MTMKILVPIRQTVDANVIVLPAADGRAVDESGAARVINPFDEIALEAAVRLKEQGRAEEVITCSIGPATAEKALRTALAMGADAALLVEAETLPQPPDAAAVLATLARRVGAGLVLMGKQAIDDDLGVTAQMLAATLGWPQLMFAATMKVEDGAVVADCERDAGLRRLKAALPCVVAADLRLAEPRFVSLPNVMKARRKPLERLRPADVGFAEGWRCYTELRGVRRAERGRAGEMLADVETLLERLRQRDLWPGQ